MRLKLVHDGHFSLSPLSSLVTPVRPAPSLSQSSSSLKHTKRAQDDDTVILDEELNDDLDNDYDGVPRI